MGRPKEPLEPRFWSKVKKTDDCWLWIAGTDRDGYGKIDKVRAHRLSYEIAFGPIPCGMNVCHHCDNPLCVRPDHLFLGTPKDNTQDAVRKNRLSRTPRGPSEINKNKTHCKHGHELAGENVYVTAGQRVCRTCSAERGRRYQERKRRGTVAA